MGSHSLSTQMHTFDCEYKEVFLASAHLLHVISNKQGLHVLRKLQDLRGHRVRAASGEVEGREEAREELEDRKSEGKGSC